MTSGPPADNYGWVNDLVRTPAGRLVMVGSGNDEGSDNDFIARFTPAGKPDRSFTQAGFVGGSAAPYFRSEAVAPLASERLVDVGEAFAGPQDTLEAGKGQFGLRFLDANGGPDTAAGPDGLVRTGFPGADSGSASAAVQTSGGRVVAGGEATVAGGSRLAIARYGPHGALDTSFGSAGTVLEEVPGATDAAVVRLIEAPDRSLLVIAAATEPTSRRALLLVSRLSANGALDPAFGGDGPLRRYSVPVAACARGCPAHDFGEPTDAVLQPTPTGVRVVVSLAAADRSPVPDYQREIGPRRPHFALLGLDVAGRPDPSFGLDGRVLVDFNTAARANRVVAAPDGRLVVAGSAAEHIAMVRLLANGRPDRTFGGQGRICVTAPNGDPPHAATGLVALPDASSVIAGWAPADQVWAGGAASETAVIAKVRAQFKQSVTCFDFGLASGYHRAKIALTLNARLRLGLRIERTRGDHTHNLGLVNLGLHKPGLTTVYWNGRLHGQRLVRGCYTAKLVQLDRRRRIKRTFAARYFSIRVSAQNCYDDSAHLG